MANLVKMASLSRPLVQLRRLVAPRARSLQTRSAAGQQVSVEQQGQQNGQQAVQRHSQGQTAPARRSRRPSLTQRFGPETTELAPMIAPFLPSRMPSLLRALDSELNSFARVFDFPGLELEGDRTSSSVAPLPGVGLGAVDIQETPNAYIFKVDVPGLSKDDVKVRVTRDGVLVIEGERKQEEEKEENGFKRYERVFGQFVRRFRLPDNVEAQKIKAKTENGVLHIEVPKSEEHDKPHHDVTID